MRGPRAISERKENKMKDSLLTPARTYFKGIGDAVADRTINRKITRKFSEPRSQTITIPRRDDISLDHEVDEWCRSNGRVIQGYTVLHGDGAEVMVELQVIAAQDTETWADVAHRVALGNSLLNPADQGHEYHAMHHHLRQASVLMSGRHLQHGDETQPSRNQEVFTNCVERSTKVLTLEHGPIEIGKIAGHTVTVIAGDGKPRQATVNAHGEQDLFEIEFSPVLGGGSKLRKSVTATANHRWILRDGMVTTAIKEGDVIAAINGDVGIDAQAVVHGLIFGDGTAHKSRIDATRHFSQGRTYASIRVCKQDAVAGEIHDWLDAAGYGYTAPPSADGDRVYYIGKLEGAKQVPFTRDPEYIAGFIYGWWLADGHKGIDHALEISTANDGHAQWLEDHCAFAGFSMTTHRVMERKPGDGSFKNGKALHVMRLRKGVEWKVKSITPAGRDEVFCPEEPVTGAFVLANGLLTGNCSTSAASFLLFYLLLNGSGVGRCYDDDMMLVDWNNMPTVVPVIDMFHKDVQSGEIKAIDIRAAKHLYADRDIRVFKVPDSREGWAKAIELIERMSFQQGGAEWVLLLDFSKVRPRGSPIAGMQNRPASGPGPLMEAIRNIATVRGSGMPAWRASMYIDHYSAECVLVGGARRAARMATKSWRDPGVIDFINVKRPIEFLGKSGEEIEEIKKTSWPMGFLWSSNNSVTTDKEFWDAVGACVEDPETFRHAASPLQQHAWRVYVALCEASYFDGTGEPGIINVDKLEWKENEADVFDGNFAESARYKLDKETFDLTDALARAWRGKEYKVIVNPCGEIVLSSLGGYCVIADVVPFHAASVQRSMYGIPEEDVQRVWDDDAEDAFRVSTRALIRTNLMDCLYGREVKRTNRIGVGITGFHEWAWARFGFSWREIIDETTSLPMWKTLSRFKRAIDQEAAAYSAKLGVVTPHTNTTFKPAGTTSKLFGLTEGAHLPSMREYLRWVQFRNDDPLIESYAAKGYPIKRLQTYSGTTIVGFPTAPMICTLGMGDKLVTAAEATPEEQYQFLRLMEKYWINGVDESGEALTSGTGNQISYTLKMDPEKVNFEHYMRTILEGQSTVKCCSVMLQQDMTAYEYQPEEPVDKLRFEMICQAIRKDEQELKEDIGLEHVDCSTGACPISFDENK